MDLLSPGLNSILGNHFHRLLINGPSSKPKDVAFGVPQGSVLGPLHFFHCMCHHWLTLLTCISSIDICMLMAVNYISFLIMTRPQFNKSAFLRLLRFCLEDYRLYKIMLQVHFNCYSLSLATYHLPLLQHLHWLEIDKSITLKILVYVYNCLNRETEFLLTYPCSSIHILSSSLRYNSDNLLPVPRSTQQIWRQRLFLRCIPPEERLPLTIFGSLPLFYTLP